MRSKDGGTKDRCLRGQLHVSNGVKLCAAIGTIVVLCIATGLYLKFRKAMFVLLLPSTVILLTLTAVIKKEAVLMWPIIASSCFHLMLCAYGLLVFSFYFIFKPFYIIMVLNWAFDTLHNDKTASYYVQCGCIFLGLISIILFSLWQASVALAYKEVLLRDRRVVQSSQPTILVVNKPPEYMSSQY